MAEKELHFDMSELTVTFLPSNKQVKISQGETLYSAAVKGGLYINAICGGKGSCKKCEVTLLPSRERVLACTYTPTTDLTVSLTDLESIWNCGIADIEPCEFGDPIFRAFYLSLTPPTPEDPTDDLKRLSEGLEHFFGDKLKLQIPLYILRTLPSVLRKYDWKPFLICRKLGQELSIYHIGEERQFLSSLLDLGTTTIRLLLYNPLTGEPVASAATINSQALFGVDIINRIIASENEDLATLAVESINRLIAFLAPQLPIYGMLISANNVMVHLLTGISASYLRREPYVPAISHLPIQNAELFHIEVQGELLALPSISAYVGGDLVSGALQTELYESELPSLLIDFGTNGEILLACSEFSISAACSAGPAFEGGGIKCGTWAHPGAIERCYLSDGQIKYDLISGAPPSGICGSGIISLLANLYRASLVNGAGRLQSGNSFILNAEHGIYIDNDDIKNLLRAKAAIFAGAQLLLNKVGMTWEDLEQIYISGGLSLSLDIEDAITIGLLPDLPRDRFVKLGNSSLRGAYKLAMNGTLLQRVDEFADETLYADLSSDFEFNDLWSRALFIPHTDRELFPSVKRSL